MTRAVVSFGPAEIEAIKAIDEKFPEWKFLDTSKKFKAVFWYGIKQLIETKQNLYTFRFNKSLVI